MKSAALNDYGANLAKIAETNARSLQLDVIRDNSFKASLVADPWSRRSVPERSEPVLAPNLRKRD